MKNGRTDDLKARRARHMEAVMRERREYYKKRDREILHPDQFCSIIVDVADHSAFGISHFVTKTKEERGKSMKVRLIGILDHTRYNMLNLFTMNEDHQTGANHIVETVHRFLLNRSASAPLPPKLFNQLDNCTRENKNRYLMAYLESLVAWKVLDEIQVGFLPIDHTHEDIDQTLSKTSERLRSNNAVTLSDLHRRLRQAYNKQLFLVHMKSVANLSQLWEESNALRSMPAFSHFSSFLFSRTRGGVSTSVTFTSCQVKVSVTDEWNNLGQTKSGTSNGFLRRTPDRSGTPPTVIMAPEGKEEVTKRFEALEGGTNCQKTMQELYSLQDHVFRSRQEIFHWDLRACVEGKGSGASQFIEVQDEDGDEENLDDIVDSLMFDDGASGHDSPRSRYEYDLGSFVTVRCREEESGTPIWIAKVLRVVRDNDQVVNSLQVHCFGAYKDSEWITSKYGPTYKPGRRSRVGHPWKDVVSTGAVVLNFAALKKSHHLPAAVQKQLRSEMTAARK